MCGICCKPKTFRRYAEVFFQEKQSKKEDTIMLGNSIADHMAALDAGVDFAYCMWGTNEKHEVSAIELHLPEEILGLV